MKFKNQLHLYRRAILDIFNILLNIENRNRKILEHLEEQKRRLRGGQGASVSNPIPNR